MTKNITEKCAQNVQNAMKVVLAAAIFLAVIFAFFGTASAKSVLNVPAIDAKGEGLMTTMQAEVVPSNLSGVFIDVKPFVSVETQQSAELAAKIAARKAGTSIEKKTVLFKILADAEVVDGPSGGAALALLAYAEFANKSALLRSDLAITGSIEQDGSIGKIGGVAEKVRSALKTGRIKLFLVPLGQSRQEGADLKQLGEANGMQVVEVADLNEVIAIAFTPQGSRVTEPKHSTPPLVLENAPKSSQAAQQMRVLAQNEINALENISKTLEELLLVQNPNNSKAKQVKDSVDDALNTTRYLLSKEYLYSAANLAFVMETNAEAFLLENISKEELTARLDELQEQLQPSFEKKFSSAFNKATLENWEWIAGAQARYQWARKKAAEVRLKLAVSKNKNAKNSSEFSSLVVDYLSARNWLRAAEGMATIAGRSVEGGQLANEVNARANVLEMIKAANESLSSIFDDEAIWHLQTAEQAFQEKNYFGATIDACFALSFARARKKALDALGEDFNALLENASGLATREGVWAQLYFIHSLYLKNEGNRTKEFIYYFNALKLQELSDCLTANAKDFKTILTKPPSEVASGWEENAKGVPTISPTILVETALNTTPFSVRTIIETDSTSIKLLLLLDIILAILLAIAIILILRLREHEAHKPLQTNKTKRFYRKAQRLEKRG